MKNKEDDQEFDFEMKESFNMCRAYVEGALSQFRPKGEAGRRKAVKSIMLIFDTTVKGMEMQLTLSVIELSENRKQLAEIVNSHIRAYDFGHDTLAGTSAKITGRIIEFAFRVFGEKATFFCQPQSLN